LTLTGPPPTKHDAGLESTVALFVREDLSCRVQAVHRYDNTRASTGLFDSVLADELARIRALR
jgi:hypothetical protein